MNIFSFISLFGGLALFLFGMNQLGGGLEKIAGGRLGQILEGLTSNVFKSVCLGALVTAAVQSSSATTVIVVGLVNSRMLKLKQAIGVIMGANIGTTITAHIIRMSDIGSDNLLLNLIKPTTLAPLAAIIGILLVMGGKHPRHKDAGQILLGFGILFTGMFNMEAAVEVLRTHPSFAEMFATLSNPILGVLAGAFVTAVIQSSSASVGILQALCSTGQITFATAFPIIMGQNIGTCITPMLASIGASKNAKRSAIVHLTFNVLGTALFLIATYSLQMAIGLPFWNDAIDKGGIANFHTFFNVVVTLSFIPFVSLLEKVAIWAIKEDPSEQQANEEDITSELDDRFIVAPGIAIDHARKAVVKMGEMARENFLNACSMFHKYDPQVHEIAKELEDAIDVLEDRVGIYLLKISQKDLNEYDSRSISELFHVVSEYERMGDYANNMMECAEEMTKKGVDFSSQGMSEIETMCEAVLEIMDITSAAFGSSDAKLATNIEPLEEVIDIIEETLRERHINRLKEGLCSADAAFPFVESLSCLERIADHCSNVGTYIITHENPRSDMDKHDYIKTIHKGETEHFAENFSRYEAKYYSKIAQ